MEKEVCRNVLLLFELVRFDNELPIKVVNNISDKLLGIVLQCHN